MSGTPFQTKFTLGLLTITPCPLDDEIECDTEEVSNDVKAEHAMENEAAKAAIAARKAKKVARQKSRSASPGKKPSRTKSRSQSPASRKKKEQAMAAKKKQLEEQEAAKKKKELEEEEKAKKLAQEEAEKAKKLEEEAARKAAEAKRLAEEEAAEEAALAEFAALAEKEEKARQQAQQEEEEAIMDASMDTSMASIVPRPTRFRPKRRISMFPACKSNIGLNQALQRYGSDVPFDWEKPEWTKEHVDLKHTSQVNKTYGWEKPDWARRSILKKTTLGDVVKQGVSLDRRLSKNSGTSRVLLRRRHSLTGRSSFDKTTKEFGWSQPEWARRNMLRTTEFGEAARQGVSLEVPVRVFKSIGGSDDDMCYHHNASMEESFASLNASKQRMSIIAWEKPEWAKKQTLKSTSTGQAVRQGIDLSLRMGDESRTRTRTRDDKSPNSSAGNLDFSEKNNANIQREKPAWANVSLKRTSKGETMKTKGNLANPITPRRSKSSDY